MVCPEEEGRHLRYVAMLQLCRGPVKSSLSAICHLGLELLKQNVFEGFSLPVNVNAKNKSKQNKKTKNNINQKIKISSINLFNYYLSSH